MPALNILLIAGIALTPILAWRGLRMVEIGILPLLALPFIWRRLTPQISLDRTDWLLIGLFAQYALMVVINIVVFPTLPGASGEAANKIGLYLGSTLILILMVLRFRMMADVTRIWRVVCPLAVLLSVAALGWEHFTSPFGENCRVGFYSKHLLIPPLWMTVLAVASYFGWSDMSGRERWLRHLALALVILATVAFSGGRAMLVAQALTIPLLAMLLGWGEALSQRARIFVVMGAVSLAGFAGGLALDIRAECQFAGRLTALVDTISKSGDAEALARQAYSNRLAATDNAATPGAELDKAAQDIAEPAATPDPQPTVMSMEDRLVGAVYIRPVLWKNALETYAEAPLTGHGFLNESALTIGDFPHFHQQYLSWLVWGGPLMLISGLLMLLAPLLTFGVRRSRDGAVLALAMILPLGVSFMAATNLLHTVMLLGYVTTLSLLYALSRQSGTDPR